MKDKKGIAVIGKILNLKFLILIGIIAVVIYYGIGRPAYLPPHFQQVGSTTIESYDGKLATIPYRFDSPVQRGLVAVVIEPTPPNRFDLQTCEGEFGWLYYEECRPAKDKIQKGYSPSRSEIFCESSACSSAGLKVEVSYGDHHYIAIKLSCDDENSPTNANVRCQGTFISDLHPEISDGFVEPVPDVEITIDDDGIPVETPSPAPLPQIQKMGVLDRISDWLHRLVETIKGWFR